MRKRSKKKYTKRCTAGLTESMFISLSNMKLELNKSKSQILREALMEYYEAHVK